MKPLIPNSLVETMFLRICTDEEMQIYVKHVEAKQIGLATAYASRIVTTAFFSLVEEAELKEAMRGGGK